MTPSLLEMTVAPPVPGASTESLCQQGQSVMMNTYNHPEMVLSHGQGCTLWDINGNAYLDFVGGIATSTLGYNHPAWTSALTQQAHTLAHCSNLYWNAPQIELATALVNHSVFDKVFFCNSGAEANDGAMKLARKYGTTLSQNAHPGKTQIITMGQSFHGRTMGALAMTGQPHYQAPFAPMVPDVITIPFNDIDALQTAITPNTCAIMVEIIQGEGGVNLIQPTFLEAIQALCHDHDMLLMIDEVQTGMGRTGTLFAYEHFLDLGITPHVMTLAKGLGGGVPIGAILATDTVAAAFQPGDHGTTFGGNPLVCKVAQAVLHELTDNGLLEQVQLMASILEAGLHTLKAQFPTAIKAIRGQGLMWGIEFEESVADLVATARQEGLLVVGAGPNVVRLVPPLVISVADIDEALEKLSLSCRRWL